VVCGVFGIAEGSVMILVEVVRVGSEGCSGGRLYDSRRGGREETKFDVGFYLSDGTFNGTS
jgi:hypothetical protein